MKRRRRNKSGFEILIELTMSLIIIAMYITYRVVLFTFDVLTFYTSQYHKKSGNGFFKTYLDKGHYGEFVLYRKVIKIFGKSAVLTNLYLDSVNTESTEIDVLAISSKGIYVFEMKNYAGFIYGSEKDKFWTQVFNKWSKHRFYNPLRQNYAHSKAVENYLDIDEEYLIPVIVFSNRSKLRKINISPTTNVFQFSGAMKFIKNNEKRGLDIISDQDKLVYLTKLYDKCLVDEETKLKHIADVKSLTKMN